MSAAARLAAFALVLAVLFAAAAVAGRALGPLERGGAAASAEHGEEAMGPPPGLSQAADGLRLELGSSTLEPGREQELALRIVRDDGSPLLDYDVTHERELHVIVVRRDLSGFQHLHPERRPDGTWQLTVGPLEPGAHRVFADFSVDGEKRTLGTDVLVAGSFEPTPLPAPATRAADVELLPGPRVAGEEVRLEFAAEGVELENYLGARGHLVILRAGDLAYLHTHAEEDELAFETTFPSAGRYRLFLQYSTGGRVRTAELTVDVR